MTEITKLPVSLYADDYGETERFNCSLFLIASGLDLLAGGSRRPRDPRHEKIRSRFAPSVAVTSLECTPEPRDLGRALMNCLVIKRTGIFSPRRRLSGIGNGGDNKLPGVHLVKQSSCPLRCALAV